MRNRLLYLLFTLAFFSCGVVPRTHNNGTAVYSGSIPADIPDSLRAFYYYVEGIKAASVEGDNVKARSWFEKTLAEDSLFSPAYFEIAELLMDKQPAEAVLFSRRAGDIDSLNVTYRSQLGRALISSAKYDEALPIYGKLLKEDPHNPVNYRMLAALYDFNGQPFTAIAILDTAEYKLGRMEELSSYKRQLLINVRMFDKALEETNALINDYPYDDANYLIKADIYRRMGRDSAALANYREALRIDSTNIMTLGAVADFYRQKGDNSRYLAVVRRIFESDSFPVNSKEDVFKELTSNIDYYRANYLAINNLATTLITKHPGEFSILSLYATHLIRSGEIEAALRLYKSYIDGSPQVSVAPYFAVLDIESYLQRPDSVIEYSDLALRAFPGNTDLYLRKGFAMGNMKQDKEALKAYDNAYKHAENDTVRSTVAGIIGDHYHQGGDMKKMYSAYRRALKLNPDNETVLNNYAYYLSEEDRELEKALEMSGRANELSPSNSTFLDTHAWILYKLGRYEEAKKYMLQAVSLDNTGSEVLLLHYGDILYELGDHFMAGTYWRRALEKGYDPKEIEARLKKLE